MNPKLRRRLWRWRIAITERIRAWRNRNKPSVSLDIKDSKHVYKITPRR